MATNTISSNNKTNKRPSSKQQNNKKNAAAAATTPISIRARILVLHGNRQTGQLLLGRLAKLRKQLLQVLGVELVALDAPFAAGNDNSDTGNMMRTWWHRHENTYEGLQESMNLVEQTWNNNNNNNCNKSSSDSTIPFVGLLGFSQGARLVHLLAVQHQEHCAGDFLPGLQFVMLVAGYDAPSPPLDTHQHPDAAVTSASAADAADSNTTSAASVSSLITIPSLHVWGEADRLVWPAQSQAVTQHYQNPDTHVHESGHHVPMRAASVRRYVEFVRQHLKLSNGDGGGGVHQQQDCLPAEKVAVQPPTPTTKKNEPRETTNVETTPQNSSSSNWVVPDEDTVLQQQDEVEALQAIYPDEFHWLSKTHPSDNIDSSIMYEHPITYTLDLPASDEGVWPPHPIQLHVTYPHDYPSSSNSNSIPILQLQHANDGLQFNSSQVTACLAAVRQAAYNEEGMPCVLACLYAAREFFESGAMAIHGGTTSNNTATATTATNESNNNNNNNVSDDDDDGEVAGNSTTRLLKAASPERIKECNQQGLEIAERLLYGTKNGQQLVTSTTAAEAASETAGSNKKGGLWLFTIGLVGKPSAGKSTLFNTATGFARQKQQQAAELSSTTKKKDVDMDQLGGATMAPHPFTTIQPNIGYCLVPAPPGSCPEETISSSSSSSSHATLTIGSTHGRDSRGRRLLPVLCKDVAGLVPGAYQGRGRGNQFLNDLTDADVLIHVLDASGRADPEGNVVIGDGDDDDDVDDETISNSDSNRHGALHPLNDMAWIQNELIEWVYTNLALKWETVRRKGRGKLQGMFSGYGQPQAMTWNLLQAVERYLEQEEHRDRALDRLEEWDAGDLHRLVSAFLGVRFPIALALNKMDLPGSQKHIDDILTALPIHGTHTGTPLSARSEMLFVRREIEAVIRGITPIAKDEEAQIPLGTWQCLQSAIGLREPVLVFPVMDHTTYAPLPGMFKCATSDPSLPSPGMISCLKAAGGSAPTEWDPVSGQYSVPKAGGTKKQPTACSSSLRDALIMKPQSTVEDVFLALKKLGALGGEFVRAEASGEIGAPAKPIPKYQVVTKQTRILKIMTNKRTAWQSSYS